VRENIYCNTADRDNHFGIEINQDNHNLVYGKRWQKGREETPL
jgi:hypothetical protein